ncbi:MAG: electron transport complex subunit RsxE [Mollicutes bacterium]|nr:electron transport complex subunit RsxE [Mollicutes bacterium]MDY3209929.1 electron transport complex subunit RsxE [Candidatus Enterosoma sp.]MDD7037563.1 electron transport complex subunit RsxE [Mollicutes bacterium]MDD7613200.1 electron transport complex subunit RsxE [Mollicutes bacterium]MDY4643565.1 electron transport complex subunit RsxE [Candidatus Enterosoma sp.]
MIANKETAVTETATKAPKQKSESSLRHKAAFVTGIFKNNPLFIAVLGTCPALAVTTSFETALGMGILFTFVLVCSNVIISLLRKLIPEEIEIPAFIVIIAAFVTIVKRFTNAFIPNLYASLGVFLSLIVVNCVVLGRAEAFAKYNGPLDSLLDGLGNGIGYTLAIVIIALIREILGTGRLTFGKVFTFIPTYSLPILKGASFDFSRSVFTNAAGGFIVFGVVLFVINAITLHKQNKKKFELKKQRMNAAKTAKKGA